MASLTNAPALLSHSRRLKPCLIRFLITPLNLKGRVEVGGLEGSAGRAQLSVCVNESSDRQHVNVWVYFRMAGKEGDWGHGGFTDSIFKAWLV